jgi:uncharacterized protein DUF2569
LLLFPFFDTVSLCRAFGGINLIYCSQCGSEVSAADAACLACGRALPAASNHPPASVAGINVAVSPDRLLHPYYGVGGWLAIFIFSIVFVGPAYHFWYAVQHYTDNMELIAGSEHPHSLYVFYLVQTATRIAVYGYGMFAGILLWRIRPNAVQHAKQFLIVLLVLPVANFVMGINWFTLIFSEEARTIALSSSLARTVPVILRAAIYSAVWYAYLSRSERIQVTYAKNS